MQTNFYPIIKGYTLYYMYIYIHIIFRSRVDIYCNLTCQHSFHSANWAVHHNWRSVRAGSSQLNADTRRYITIENRYGTVHHNWSSVRDGTSQLNVDKGRYITIEGRYGTVHHNWMSVRDGTSELLYWGAQLIEQVQGTQYPTPFRSI